MQQSFIVENNAGGGGSIASVDSMSRIHVGPESAGAEPGPASYGRGGTEPTTTEPPTVEPTPKGRCLAMSTRVLTA